MTSHSTLLLCTLLAGCLSYIWQLQAELHSLHLHTQTLETLAKRDKIEPFAGLSQRHPANPDWVNEEREHDILHPPVETADDSIHLLRSNWEGYLRKHTPSAWEGEKAKVDCASPEGVVVPVELLKGSDGKGEFEFALEKARIALKECGFVYLDNLFSREQVEAFRDAFVAFRASKESESFRYPCQGEGRVEHMVPFRPPFNTTQLYADPHLLAVIQRFLNAKVKLELMTVIDSPPGSGDQRWHQGWSFLFHEEERLPPYSVVATLPLEDITLEMGPTEFCMEKKLRWYHGWRCPRDLVVSASLTVGSMALFDYRLLHRGPANRANKSRPMVSMVFSNLFFINSNAFVNRALSFEQTIHQRLYWEQFFWHPSSQEEYFVV